MKLIEIFFRFQLLILLFSVFSRGIICKNNPGNALGKTRILSEIRDIYRHKISTDQPFNLTNDEIGIRLSPMKGNLLEFHFSFTGTEGSSYSGGIYHGRILLHPDYPRKAPSISVLTPTGRWECGKDICLSATAHHQETWDPNWNLRTLVMALRGHILTQPREIGGILTSTDHQQKLAILSRSWSCPHCGLQHAHLVPGSNSTILNSGVGELSRSAYRGFTVDINAEGRIDTERLISLAESEGLKEVQLMTRSFRQKNIAKSLRHKKQRLQLLRSIFFSLFVGFAVFFFQFWSIGNHSPSRKSFDSNALIW